jgi:hypothetical protein
MELRQFIRADVTASAIAHLSILALVFVFTEVHPFGTVTAEPIAVDIVTPDEVPAKQPELPPSPPPTPDPPPQDKLEAAKPEPLNLPAPAPPSAQQQPSPPAEQPAQAPAQKQAARPNRKEAAAPPPPAQPAPPPAPQPEPQQMAAAAPAYKQPEPDLTLKYHVMLGLPEALPPLPAAPSSPGDRPGDGVDATASSEANIAASAIAEFRRHLKACSKLPASVDPADKVKIRLRVMMTPDGRLAREPILIEASASTKGPLLMQSAMAALAACQPYAMLPAERYGEWKVIDLSFTPDDFSS